MHTHFLPDVPGKHANAFWPPKTPSLPPSLSLHYDPHPRYFSIVASITNWHEIATVALTDVSVSNWSQGHDVN